MYRDTRLTSPHIDHSNQARPGLTPFPDRLYVVTPIVNQQRYARRYELYRAFARHMQQSGVILYTVELAFGDRPFEVTSRSDPRNIQFRTDQELWYKEQLINLAIARLPPEAKYVAWIDADLSFVRPDWAQETLHQLQHYQVVQLFSHVVGLSYDSVPLSQSLGFVEGWKQGIPFKTAAGSAADVAAYRRVPGVSVQAYPEPGVAAPKAAMGWAGSPGGAWAARRDALDALGGLIDYAILGSGDYHFATGLMGFMELSLSPGYHPAYTRMLLDWQQNALKTVQRNVGHVLGTVCHHWHGAMRDRGYGDRWRILVRNQFNPATDLKRDSSGLWQLTSEKPQLRDDIRAYFCSRNEDAIA